MMGASTSFMMRSMPRRNGSIWPMRVIWPSAKDAHDLAVLDRLARLPQRMDHLARPLLEEIGMSRMILANGLTSGCS